MQKPSPPGIFPDNLQNSIHSSDSNSLQISDDETDTAAVATTRLNTWLNGGASDNTVQLGNGTITSTTPVHPFIASDNLPSPFSVKPPPKSTTPTTLRVVDIPDIVDGQTDAIDRSRILPSPPKTIGASLNSFQTSNLSPPNEITSSRPTVFAGGADIDRKPHDAKKETINGDSFQIPQASGDNSNPVPDRIITDTRPSKPHHRHQRSVSWGENPDMTTIPPKAPKLSPKLSPIHSSRHIRGPSEFSLFSVLTQTDSEVSTRNTRSDSSRVNMDELLRLNPLETEAETLILKVIEAQENDVRKRANTGHSTNILDNIPDDSAHIFMPQIETVSSKSSVTGTIKSSRHIFDTEEPHGSERSNRSHSNTNDFGPTITHSVNISNIASSAPAAAAPIQSKQRPPRPNLTRNATVEHKLANLTETLAGYHNKTGDHKNNVNSPYLRQDLEDDDVHTTDVSAGEKLAKNASLIYRGRQKTDGKKTDKVTDDASTKTSKWTKVRVVTSISKPLVAGTTNQCASNYHVPGASGSVDQQKKSDRIKEDTVISQPDDAMECGNAADLQDDHRTNLNESGTNQKMRNSRKVFHKIPIIHSMTARDFRVFVGQRRSDLFDYLRFMVVVVLPALATSVILFYLAGNPNSGIVDLEQSGNGTLFNKEGKSIDPRRASVSWWLIFICVRQTLTFSGAQLLQVIVIDFLCLSTRFSVNVFGSLLTLLIVQSKGWPFIVIMWGVLNFTLLFGSSRFVNHWLFWQDLFSIFNERNPSGEITSDDRYTLTLSIAVCLGFIVALKRLWLGLFLGRKTYINYAEDLTKLVDKIVILCEVAALSREIDDETIYPNSIRRSLSVTQYGITKEEFNGMLVESNMDEGSTISRNQKDIDYNGGLIVDPTKSDLRRARLDQSQRAKITELLGAWEEPDAEMSAEDDVSISGILQFRNSLAYLNNPYMFSIAWGETTTRDRTIVGSQDVFGKLMKRSLDPNLLKFEVLAAVAKQSDGTLNFDKLRRIIRILRPDRDGYLSLLEFVKSVDVIYKEAKLLRASVLNSEKIDRAFEKACNVVFYILVLCVTLSVVGLNPLRLIVSLTSVIVGFAFVVGSASSKMFEGWLFILIRRPYNIGDRIHISNVEKDASPDGSLGWIVKDLTLFHTTAVFGMTGERATMSNGSLASTRVINMARSPKAMVYIYLKFSTDIPYERVQIFEKAIREFIKSRPREWANFAGFRATKVLADLGYIEYVVVLTHREAWQSIISILESKAEVSSFCLELSKKLDMRYKSPPLPVDLELVQRNPPPNNTTMSTTAIEQPWTDSHTGSGITTTTTDTLKSGLDTRIAAALAANEELSSTAQYKEVLAMFDRTDPMK